MTANLVFAYSGMAFRYAINVRAVSSNSWNVGAGNDMSANTDCELTGFDLDKVRGYARRRN